MEGTEDLQGCIEEMTLVLKEKYMGKGLRDILQETNGKGYGTV